MSQEIRQPNSSLVAWCQLSRIGLVLSAPSNILLGAFLARDWAAWPAGPLLLLCLSSVCLYLSGMVLNDWFDREADARERPSRPIPSGRIRAKSALLAGAVLMSLGIALAGAVSLLLWCPLAVTASAIISVLVLLYNGVAKSGPLGPLVMGGCRAMNVLLGATIAADLPGRWPVLGALAVGVYVMGVTLIARYEAEKVPAWAVHAGTALFLGPILVMMGMVYRDPNPASPWTILLGLWIVLQWARLKDRLLVQNSGPAVPQTIGGLLGLLIPIDALLASAWVGFLGFSLLGLWLIAKQLRRFRWLYAS